MLLCRLKVYFVFCLQSANLSIFYSIWKWCWHQMKNMLLKCKEHYKLKYCICKLQSLIKILRTAASKGCINSVTWTLNNKTKVTWARTSFQIALLQNHFNFICATLHPDRGGDLRVCWPDDKARPLPDGTVNKQPGSKKMLSSGNHCSMVWIGF